MKYIKFLLLIGLVGMFSCTTDDDHTGASIQSHTNQETTVAVTSEFPEGGMNSMTLSIPNTQDVDLHYSITLGEGGSATPGVDHTFDHADLIIPAYTTSASFSFEAMGDMITEGDETVELLIASTGNTNLAAESVTVTIKDVIDERTLLFFDWNVDFVFDGATYQTCDFVDLDVYILDDTGADMGIYDAATGACPEMIDISDWADGTYYLASNMWSNATLAPLMLNIDYPITARIFKQSAGLDANYVPEDKWTSETPDQANDGNADFKEVGILIMNNGQATLQQPDGTVIGSGFQAPHKTPNK